MANQDWISISKAVEHIVDRDVKRLGEFRLELYTQAWRALGDRLKSSELCARPNSREDYKCSFTSTSRNEVVPLNDDGTIPATFWFHFEEALAMRPAIATLVGGTNASRDQDNFHFLQVEGLIDNGRLEGRARGVTVNRDGLGNLLPRPGGRKGTRKVDRIPVLTRADRSIKSGRQTPASALAHFWKQIDDPSATDDSKRRWLRRALERKGYIFPPR